MNNAKKRIHQKINRTVRREIMLVSLLLTFFLFGVSWEYYTILEEYPEYEPPLRGLVLIAFAAGLFYLRHFAIWFVWFYNFRWKKIFLKEFREIHEDALEKTIQQMYPPKSNVLHYPDNFAIIAMSLVCCFEAEQKGLTLHSDDANLVQIYRSFLPKAV
jgi:hypothetical protein